MGINHYLILCYKKPGHFNRLLNELIMAKQANKIMFIIDSIFDPLILGDTYQVIIKEFFKDSENTIRDTLIYLIPLMIDNGLSDLFLKIFIKYEKTLLNYNMHLKFAENATTKMMINKDPLLIKLLHHLSDTKKLLPILNSDQNIYGLLKQPNALYFLMFHNKINKIKNEQNIIMEFKHNFSLVIFIINAI